MMASIAHLWSFLVALAIILMAVTTARAASCFRVQAAFTFKNKVYLIDGNKYIVTDSGLNEEGVGTLSADFSGYDGQPDAAFFDPRTDEIYFFQGGNYRSYDPWGKWLTPSYESKLFWGAFYENGINAITTARRQRLIFNKQCQFLLNDFTGKPRANTDIGLPCDVSAAWSDRIYVYVIAEDTLYVLSASSLQRVNTMTLSQTASISSVSLCQ